MEPDFSQMYAELGLRPDCSLEQFKRAYRQRISELHPDRAPRRASAAGGLALGDLIALQSAALAFHREHGRLPGSTLRHAPADTAAARPLASHPPRPSDDGDDRTPFARWPIAALLLAGALLAGVFLDNPDPSPPAPPAASAPVADPLPQPAADAVPSGPLELGMDAATVRGIQGEPMRIDDNTWEYGPSWLRIEHNRLVDWYSSPLYRLKTRTTSPDSSDRPTE